MNVFPKLSVFHFTEGKCPTVNSVCEGNPCPEGTECLGDPKEGKYTCVCHDSKAGQCPGEKFSLKKNLWLKPYYYFPKVNLIPIQC